MGNTHIFSCSDHWSVSLCTSSHACLLVFFFFFYVQMKRLDAHTLCSPKASTLLTALPELTGLTVHSRQQQPGSLPDIIAVHGETASVFGVNHCHAHPLHERRQHHERPIGGDRDTCSGHQRLTLNFSHSQYLVCPGTCKKNPPNTEFACYFEDLARLGGCLRTGWTLYRRWNQSPKSSMSQRDTLMWENPNWARS